MATARERIRLVLGRLVAAALRRSGIICAVSVTAGLVLLLLLPALSAPTYVDENALMPGSASPRYSESDARYAIALLQSLHTHRGSFDEWIAHHLRALQLPLYPHVWSPSSSRLTRTHLSTRPSDDDGDGGDGAGGGGQGGEGIDGAVEQEQVQAAESIATPHLPALRVSSAFLPAESSRHSSSRAGSSPRVPALSLGCPCGHHSPPLAAPLRQPPLIPESPPFRPTPLVTPPHASPLSPALTPLTPLTPLIPPPVVSPPHEPDSLPATLDNHHSLLSGHCRFSLVVYHLPFCC
ncbi:unnamed protein product [Closterium sp. Naga37s-1]|nr:unnamed protein product [Closterium sp. Naga37s-1]